MVEYYADMEPPCPTNRTVEAFYGNTWGTAELVSTNIQLVATDDPFKEVPGYWPTFYGAAAYLDGKYMIATGQMCNFALRSAETKLTFPGMDNYCKFVKDGTKNGDLTDYGYFWPSNTFEEGFSFNRSVQFNIYDVSKDSWDSSKWDGSGPPTYIDMQSDKCGARWIYDEWVVQEAVSVDGVRSGNGQAFLYDFDESGTPSFFVHGGYPSWDGTFSIYNPNRKPITDPESPYGAWSGSSAASNFSSGYKCQYGGGAVCIDGIAYVIGGSFWGNGSCCMQTYNTKSDQWTSYENIYSDNLINFGISKWGSKIYIVGDSRVSSKIRIMETATNVFKLVDSDLELQIPVRDVSVACYKDVIYAMGGRTKDESNALIPLDTVQIVDMNRRTSLVHDTKLPVASYYASCDVTEYGKLLFGGSMLARDQQTGKDVACSRFWASYLPNEGLDDITINAVTSEGGTLSVSPAQEQYAYGDVITITATPGSGYELKRAYCDDFETTNLVSSYTVTHSTTIRAEFTKRVDPGVLFYEDFEDYAVGTEVVGTVDGWNFYSTYEGNTTVVDDAPGIDGKAMLLSRSSGGSDEYVMVFTPSFNLDIENPAVGLVRISTRVVIASDQDLFALYDKNGSRYFYLNGNRSAGTLESGPSGVKFTNLYTDASTPNEISIIWDPFAKKIVQIICNGEVKDCEISPNGTCEQPSRLRLSTRLGMLNGATGSYYDFIGVSSFARSSDPLLCCDEEAVIPLDAASIEFDIFNAGSSSSVINYSVSTDSPWLEVTPSSGSFNESATLTLKPKNGLAEGFYRGSMTVDGGAAGTQIVSVMCSKGDVIFAEDFNTMEDGNIVGQRGWTVDVGNVVITNAYNCDEKCMFAYRAAGNNGCSKYLPKPWYENLVVKVSFDMYWPSDSDAEFFYVLQKDSDTNEKFEAHIYPADDGFELYNILARSAQSIGDFPTAPYDTWVQVEYTIDFRANMLLSFGWNGTVTNFTNFTLKNPDCNFFNSWGIAAWSGEANGSRIAVDNLMIKRVACEGDSKLMLPSYKAIGTNDSIDIQMKNGGTDSFDYTAEVIDLSDALTITNPTGTVDASANLSISVDRSGLKDNFYRSRIKVDAGEAGCTTCIVSFVKGDVYYYADFEEPFFTLGDITGQDEWGNDNQNGNVAYVLSTNDTQVLMVETGGGWGGYFHDLQVPANKLVRFDCDFFFPPDIFDREDLIGREVIYLKQNSKFISAADITLDIDFVDGVPIVYGHDHANDCIYSTTEYTEEWMHVSYVIDYKEGKLVEFAINGNTEHPADADINEEYVGSGCNLFCMCVTYEGNIQFDNVSVRTIPTTGFDLTTSSSEGGTIAIAPVKGNYTYGDVVTITATPDPGYELEKVYCDDFETTNLVSTYTVTHSTTFRAKFRKCEYKCSVTTVGEGSVTISPEKEVYYYGDVLTLTAIPETNYAFEGFSGSVTSTDDTVEVTVTNHLDITATFYFDAYKLNLTTGSGGSVTVVPDKETYHLNEKVTLTAVPDEGYAFYGYTGTAESTNLVLKVTMDQHHEIAAAFYFDAYTLTLTTSEGGTVTVEPEKETYHRNEVVTLTAVPDEGYAFEGYTGTAESTNLVLEVTMDQHHEIAAEFYFDAYTLTLTTSGGGTVTVEPEKETYHNEEEVTISANPEVGYAFANYSGTLESTDNPLVIKMTQHYELTANFTNLEYVVTCDVAEGGSIVLDPQKSSYHYNDEVGYSVKLEKGYSFVEIQGYEQVLTNATGTITVTDNLTLTPVFELEEYSMTCVSTFGGSVAIEPAKDSYHYNDVIIIETTPDNGYVLRQLLVNGEAIEGSTYVIEGDTEIKAVFVYGDEKPSGKGTEEAPYTIANVANLLWLSRNTKTTVGAYSVLSADIDLSLCEDWLDGLGFEPIGSEAEPFQGYFDGRSFSIKGLYVNDPDMEGAGLFGYAKGSEIKNLTISEAKVTASQNVGLLVGCGEGCTIKNVSVAGRVNAETNTALLVGSVNNITAEIVCAEGYAEGGENVAGLIGCATDSSINNAFTVANVSACNNAGGFVGTAIYTTLTYGYAAGSTTSSGSQGGVFGTATESTVISSFFDKSQAGDNGYGKAVTAEALLKRETFSDWDFINVWEMSDGITKPFFRHLDTKWVKRVGTSQCKLNLSGFLAPDDFQDICDSLEVALYASEDNTMIVEPKMINTLPVKEKSLKIQYNAKKRMFKYTSTLPSVTLARFDGQVAAPCEVTKPKRKLNFTSTLNEDISNELIGKWICLSDDCMEFHILSGTKVKLSNNGKSLTYKGTVKNVTMQISLSIKNRKFNMKYVAPNTINLVTEE